MRHNIKLSKLRESITFSFFIMTPTEEKNVFLNKRKEIKFLEMICVWYHLRPSATNYV